MLKICKKMLKKQYAGIRDRRQRGGFINETVRIFQVVESFMKIQIRSGNGRRHYTSLCKIKIMIVRPTMKK